MCIMWSVCIGDRLACFCNFGDAFTCDDYCNDSSIDSISFVEKRALAVMDKYYYIVYGNTLMEQIDDIKLYDEKLGLN